MGMYCSVVGWVCCALLWVKDVKDGFKYGVMAEQYSSSMSSGTKRIF